MPQQERPPSLVSETVSVVLRRQVPPRFDEPARSWLGGLPCMPEAIEWPRSISSEYPDRGERPLHFLAQICCADLPAELWGGLGPRHGWLLLFLDPNQGGPEDNGAFRVLHIAELGPEHPPPFDLGPVHDGVYTGADYRWVMPDEPVPEVWRRWPLDLVTVPNEARQEDGRIRVTPENFAAILYDGAPVADPRSRCEVIRPFTCRQALHALGELMRVVDRERKPARLPDSFIARIREDGAIAAIIGRCREEAAKAADKLEQTRAELATPTPKREFLERYEPWLRGEIDRMQRLAEWLAEMGGAESIIRHLESPASCNAWADRLRPQVAAAIADLRGRDPDTPFSDLDWRKLVETFAGQDLTYWSDDPSPKVEGIPFREISVSTTISAPAAMPHSIADMYVDVKRRSLVPDAAIGCYEPHWRRLYDNRPHRMGGYHDGVQSEAVLGPARELLLFQIATDDAMNWCCGDAGAYYFWIRPEHLAAGDFSGVQIWLEC